MEKLQVIIDSNVLLSGLKSRNGASFQLLKNIDSHLFEINLSVPLVFEYEFILKKNQKDLGLSEKEIGDFIDYLCSLANHHLIHFLWRPYLKDPYDDFILELAFDAQADYIITYNVNDFNNIEQLGLKTIFPVDFLKLIGVIK